MWTAMKAAIIIPVHNRREVTLRCLRHLKGLGLQENFRVVVVDDGSADGTSRAISAEFPEIVLLQGDGELYWTGAMLLGMQRSLKIDAKFLFWLNDDCLPEPGCLERMLEYLQMNPRSVCGASCFTEASLVPVKTAFRGRTDFSAFGNSVTEVQGLSGYCVGIPAQLCSEVGLPNAKRLPHYAGDTIYTLRAYRKGYRVVLLADAKACLLDKHDQSGFKERALASRDGRGEFIRKTFFEKKSMYYLRGQYWYHSYKYGFPVGAIYFLCKLLRWSFLTGRYAGQRQS
jgi:GT2 family glycosyltransferase